MTPEARVNHDIAQAAMHFHFCVLPMPNDLWKLHTSPWSMAEPKFHVGIFYKRNTGVAKYGRRAVRFGIPGEADWTGWLFGDGRRFELEAKSATGKLTPDQKANAALCLATGVLWGLARSYDDAVKVFESWGLRRPS